MKKKKFTGKLSLNKETISKLQDGQMERIVGGTDVLCSITPECQTVNTSKELGVSYCDPCTPASEPMCCSSPYACIPR